MSTEKASNRRIRVAVVSVVALIAVAAFIAGCDSTGFFSNGGGNNQTTTKLYVADFDRNGVVVYSVPATTNEAATVVLGQPNLTSSAGGTTASTMTGPNAVTVDGANNVWVADQLNARVLQFVPPLTSGMNASMVLGQANFTASAPATTQNGMDNPSSVTVDASGNIWVVDFSNSRVLQFKPPLTTGMNATAVLGQANFTTGAPATTQAGLNGPGGAAFDPAGNLWVVDSNNNRIVEYTTPFSNGMNASIVIGQANFTSSAPALTQSGFTDPLALTFDKNGNLWVADWQNARVLEFTPPFSNGMNAAVVLGQANFTSNTTATTQNGMTRPTAVASDSSGNLYVTESTNCRTLIFTPPFTTGMNATTVIGQPNFTSSGCAVTATGQNDPFGVATGP